MSDVLCKHALCPDTQTAFCYLFKRPKFLCPMFCVSMRYVRTRKPPFVICLNHKTADVKSTSVQCSLATSRATVPKYHVSPGVRHYIWPSLTMPGHPSLCLSLCLATVPCLPRSLSNCASKYAFTSETVVERSDLHVYRG